MSTLWQPVLSVPPRVSACQSPPWMQMVLEPLNPGRALQALGAAPYEVSVLERGCIGAQSQL